MPIVTNIMRFQCDPNKAKDPIVQLYLTETTEADGETWVRNVPEPTLISFSELAKLYADYGAEAGSYVKRKKEPGNEKD